MDDIVVRLRARAKWNPHMKAPDEWSGEAADEIERLRNQICVMQIDRQPEPDLRRAMFKAFGD